ncbi:MAG: hypothetical protein RIE86_09885 [Imperialibacter sp.]|uniref:leucine-rich repeat domain-containing protein n=1 Tax=Imperialibacter sp. TaxID=2038411 RepID=UPI0032EAA681
MWLAYLLVLQPCHAEEGKNYFRKALSKHHISKIIPASEEHQTFATEEPIVAGVFEQDYNALVALYNATDGANWTNNTGWLEEGGDVKDWYGVTVADGRVIIISLTSNNLSGQIPEEVSGLNAVQYLYLSGNQLSGSIPPEIGNLSGLKTLWLSYNQLSGTIPGEIGNLSSLEFLHLSDNQLEDQVPAEIGNLSQLQILDLPHNDLSGVLPTEIGNLSALKTLKLSFNELSASIPSEIGTLTSIEELNLSYNQLSGMIPSQVGNLTKLQSLSLHGNQLTGAIPVEIGNLIELNALNLDNNELDGPIPTEIWGLVNLQYLSLYGNQLTGTIPAEVGNLSSLISLLVADNMLSGLIPAELGALTNLNSLWLQGNLFSGTVPAEIGNLTNLTELQLGSNKFTGSLPSELGNLQSLRILNVYSNPFTGLLPQSLTNLDELGGIYGSFNYSGTYMCEPEDQEWAGWKAGRNITANNLVCSSTDLYVFRIEGEEANIDLANLTISLNLPGVDISATAAEFVVAAGASVKIGEESQVSGVTINNFSQPLTYTVTSEDGLESVEWTVHITNQSIIAGVFEQDYNALIALYNATNGTNWNNNAGWLLEGVEVRDWWGIAVNENRVTYIYSANNNLTGFIPEEIGNLTGLQYVDFNNNHLTGTIPSQIGSLPKLITFQVGGNQLSGSIPDEIGNLSNLQYLALNNNQLTGAIPVEISNLSPLLNLNLAFNQLSGTIPAEIGNLNSLQLLTFSVNQLSGVIPVEIGNLSNLENLWLASNQLTGTIPVEIGSLTNLSGLLLDGNSLTGSLPSELGNLQNLKNLNLSNNPIKGAIPQSFANLDYLAAEFNSFSYSGTNLCEPQNQEWLDWKTGRNITGSGIVCGATDLYVFRLEGIDAHIDPVTFTISLNLPGAEISATAAEFVVATGASATIGGVPQVSGTTVNDFSQPLTYTITSEDGQESVEWTVNITNQSIVAGIIEQDYNALVAFYNATGGANWTNNTGWLQEGVEAQDWYGVGVSQNRVRSISLVGNNLSGSIPDEIGNLSVVQSLYLDNNNLSGVIPAEIGNLSELQTLQLSDNQLSGTIPIEIGIEIQRLHNTKVPDFIGDRSG